MEAAKLKERWIKFPVRDRSAPDDLPALLEMLDRLIELLQHPTTVLAIHCATGVGRTGTVAGSLLVRMGLQAADALTIIEEAGSEPETDQQLASVWRS